MTDSGISKPRLPKLPDVVLVLDLETAGRNARTPERADLAVVGTKPFVWDTQGQTYRPGTYEYYGPADFPVLQQRLDSLPGLIVGHNLFNFDYIVLRRQLNLQGIIDKSVDTLFFLFKHRQNDGDLRYLSLDDLAKHNFGVGKARKASTIPQLLKAGKIAEVLAYNECDLDLTFRLWWTMVSERFIAVGPPPPKDDWDGDYGDGGFSLDAEDMERLTGVSPAFSFLSWAERLDRDGRVIPRKRKQREDDENIATRISDAQKRQQTEQQRIDQYRKPNVPPKYTHQHPDWNDERDCKEARALLGQADIAGSTWAEEVTRRLLRGADVAYKEPGLEDYPEAPSQRRTLMERIAAALATHGYLPIYTAYLNPDDDRVHLTVAPSPPPKTRTLAEQYVDKMRERYSESEALFGPADIQFSVSRAAANVHFAHTNAMNRLYGAGHVVFEDNSFVLDTDGIGLFELQPKVLTPEEIAELEG